MIEFKWDPAKSRSNLNMHGVSFEGAQSVFHDEYAIQFDNEENSLEEERFFMPGLSNELRVLIVCHCERESGEVSRIISARKATKDERKYYRGGAV